MFAVINIGKENGIECQIGWLAELVDGSFAGSIRTLTISDQIVLRPAAGEPRRAAVNYDALIGSGARMGVARVDAQCTWWNSVAGAARAHHGDRGACKSAQRVAACLAITVTIALDEQVVRFIT